MLRAPHTLDREPSQGEHTARPTLQKATALRILFIGTFSK